MAHYAFRDRPDRSTLYATIPLTLLKGRLRRLKVLSAFGSGFSRDPGGPAVAKYRG